MGVVPGSPRTLAAPGQLGAVWAHQLNSSMGLGTQVNQLRRFGEAIHTLLVTAWSRSTMVDPLSEPVAVSLTPYLECRDRVC
jgi:hypothetical protein